MEDAAAVGARLPSGFGWAAGAPAYASEGGRTLGGRGESIWDRFLRPAHVAGDDMEARGSDSLARRRDDVALAAGLGHDRLAFSIAWTRILPAGTGRPLGRGLDVYDRLVDDALAAGLRPLPILYHWDLPQRLEELGGLASPDAPRWLAGLAEAVVGRLGDRLDIVLTLAEPQVHVFRGHIDGSHAPGARDWRRALAAADGLLRGHAAMAVALRAARPGLAIGALLDRRPVEPASDASGDVDAAARVDGWANRLFLDALLGRGYPADVADALGDLLDPFRVQALAETPHDLDLVAVRPHRRETIVGGGPAPLHAGLAERAAPPVDGAAVHQVLREAAAAAPGLPLWLVAPELPSAEGDEDDARAELLLDRLAGAADAIDDGAPVVGHVAWPLIDGFAWERGDTARLGLVAHDREGTRHLRRSAHALAEAIRAHRDRHGEPPRP